MGKNQKIYDELKIPELTNRDEDNWLPLFAIARFIDGCQGDDVNSENQLKKYLENYKSIDIETDDLTQQFFELISDLVEDEPKYYTPKEISDWVDINSLLQHYKSPANWIGKQLRLYNFKQFRIAGKRKYQLSKGNVTKIINTYWHGTNDTK